MDPFSDDPTDKMKANVDVLAARVVLVILRERDSRTGCRRRGVGGIEGGPEDLGDECAQPERFLRGVRSRDVLGLGGGQGNDFLALSTPRDGHPPFKRKAYPENRTAILRHAAVRVRVPHQFPPAFPYANHSPAVPFK